MCGIHLEYTRRMPLVVESHTSRYNANISSKIEQLAAISSSLSVCEYRHK